MPRPSPHPQARAFAVLRGFDVGYTSGDHNLWQLHIAPRIEGFTPQGTELELVVEVGLRDASGNWDDGFRASVDYQIVVVDDPEVWFDIDTIGMGSAGAPGPLRGSGHVSQQVPHDFLTVALLSGFSLRYLREDHHILRMSVEAHVEERSAGEERLRTLGALVALRDASGNWDDAYNGTVTGVLLTLPPGRVLHHTVQCGYAGKSDVPVQTRGSGPFRQEKELPWDARIPYVRTLAAHATFQLAFAGGDHEFGRAVSRLEHQLPAADRLRTIYEGGLRDLSGDWDDAYTAEANFHVIGAF